MKNNACLIAGPTNLDAIQGSDNLLGGGGFYAAAAAVPFALTQLWSRSGAEIDASILRYVTARHIEIDGMGNEGATNRWDGSTFISHGPALPDSTPTSAQDLTAALLIDLSAEEGVRAFDALAALEPSTTRSLVVAPHLEACAADPDYVKICCQRANVVVLRLSDAQQLTGEHEALAAARACQDLGAKVVVLTAGALGGLACYQQKVCTWPSIPLLPKEPTGTHAAFAGGLTGSLAEAGKCDWRSLKRSLAMASAIAAATANGIGPKKLLSMDRSDYGDQFNKLRRNNKF